MIIYSYPSISGRISPISICHLVISYGVEKDDCIINGYQRNVVPGPRLSLRLAFDSHMKIA